MTANKTFYILVLLLILASCKTKETSPNEYVQWVKEYSHGLHKKKEVSGLVFDAQYKPAEYVWLVENGNTNTNKENQKQINDLKKQQYFTLKISLKDGKGDFIKEGSQSEQEVYQKLYYYSFGFQKDIYLEAGGKEYPCKLFHFERAYDLTNARTFIFSFEEDGKEQDKTLVIDSPVPGTGKIKINFSKEDIASIPTLKL